MQRRKNAMVPKPLWCNLVSLIVHLFAMGNLRCLHMERMISVTTDVVVQTTPVVANVYVRQRLNSHQGTKFTKEQRHQEPVSKQRIPDTVFTNIHSPNQGEIP